MRPAASILNIIKQRTIRKSLADVILHFLYVVLADFGGVHELALVRAARQLAEEVHQVGEAGRTSARKDR